MGLRNINTFAMVIASLLISGCDGGGNSGGGGAGGINCAAISGGGTQATQSVQCTGGACSGSNKDAAIDNNLGSFATLHLEPNAAGTVRLRATAQDGVVYPAGTPATVVYGIARSAGNSLNTAETISTYLDGVLQETGNASSTNGSTSGSKPAGRRGIGTVLQFDAIELIYAQSGGTATVDIQVYEFCTSFN